MGGFTAIYLKDTSVSNITRQNVKLELSGVPKKYRFYSELDRIKEYEYYKNKIGNYPEHLFPPDKINSFEDFIKYWSHEHLGEVFVPKIGSLVFDCYFGRTSKRAMRAIGKYLVENWREIKSTSGSFETFMERGMTKLERQIINESAILQNY